MRCGHALAWASIAVLVLVGTSACDAFVTPAHQLPPPPAATGQPGTAPTPAPTLPVPPPTATPAGAQPTVVPLAGQPIQSFRFAMVISDTTAAGTEVTRLDGEWTTEALHMVSTISTAEGDQKTESYLIGDTAYFQDAQGHWQKGPGGNPEFRTLMSPTLVLKQTQEKGGLTLAPLGTSTVDGAACARYQVSAQGTTAEAGSLFTQGIAHVGLSDGWVYRFEFERFDEGIRSQGIMTCHDYNTGIIIQPPM